MQPNPTTLPWIFRKSKKTEWTWDSLDYPFLPFLGPESLLYISLNPIVLLLDLVVVLTFILLAKGFDLIFGLHGRYIKKTQKHCHLVDFSFFFLGNGNTAYQWLIVLNFCPHLWHMPWYLFFSIFLCVFALGRGGSPGIWRVLPFGMDTKDQAGEVATELSWQLQKAASCIKYGGNESVDFFS